MEVMDAMSRRRSCRAYLPQQILNEKRDEILKAANAAQWAWVNTRTCA